MSFNLSFSAVLGHNSDFGYNWCLGSYSGISWRLVLYTWINWRLNICSNSWSRIRGQQGRVSYLLPLCFNSVKLWLIYAQNDCRVERVTASGGEVARINIAGGAGVCHLFSFLKTTVRNPEYMFLPLEKWTYYWRYGCWGIYCTCASCEASKSTYNTFQH
jgi:hypothetical protein